MALTMADAFDSYTSTANLLISKKWSSNTGWTWGAGLGRNGGGGITTSSAGASLVTRLGVTPIPNGNQQGVAFWFKSPAPPTSNQMIISGRLTTPSILVIGWGVNSSGIPILFDGSATVIATGLTPVCDGAWHWIEWSWQSYNIGMPQICYVDTALNWNASLSTTGAVFGQLGDIYVIGTTVAQTITISWPMFFNAVAGAPNTANIPLGPQAMTTLRPASDGICTFGTVSSGTNHSAMVNQVIMDGDSTYVEGVSTQQDLYHYTPLTVTPPTILTVQVNTQMYDPAAGTINYQIACKSGAAAVLLGPATPTPSSYAKIDLFSIPQDPNTGAAWTTAALNAAQFGVNIN